MNKAMPWVESKESVEVACKLLQIDEGAFAKWFTLKLLNAGNRLIQSMKFIGVLDIYGFERFL